MAIPLKIAVLVWSIAVMWIHYTKGTIFVEKLAKFDGVHSLMTESQSSALCLDKGDKKLTWTVPKVCLQGLLQYFLEWIHLVINVLEELGHGLHLSRANRMFTTLAKHKSTLTLWNQFVWLCVCVFQQLYGDWVRSLQL